ncbi:MAG TPA: lipopolysaccharide heptosyltransferase II [Myxococcota bacterium]|nr:lipopolysaccharide heptosyltransferase II [Myxococcota bacterium]
MMKPRHIIVRGPNWTGDVIMATPGFRALRAGFPEARLVLHLRPGLEALVAGSPWFDEVIPVESYQRGPAALVREAARLRGRRFDLGVCLPDSFSAALLLRLAGVREVVGWRRGFRAALLHRAPTPPGDGGGRLLMPREEHVLGLVRALGCEARGTHLELFVTAAEEAQAAAALEAAGLDPAAPRALLAPGASYGPSKLWPAERFADVGDGLARAGAAVAVIGAPGERALAERVVAAMQQPAANLAGSLSLGALKAAVRGARLLVGNDAGARHVAVAFGVPAVILMGPTALEKTGLNLDRVEVLSADVPCRPCYLRECPIDHRCMTRIEPERVLAAALPALEGPRPLRHAWGAR